MVRCDQFLLAM